MFVVSQDQSWGKHTLNLKVILQDVKKCESEALVVVCYEDVRPLKGLAGEIDWVLCGALSRLIEANRFRGSLGDVALIAPRGKIPVDKLFMLGMGPWKERTTESIRAFAKAAASSLLDAGISNSALEYTAPGSDGELDYLQALKAGLDDGSRGRPLTVTLLTQDAPTYERVSRYMNRH